MIIINHETLGDIQFFDDLQDAQSSLVDCGFDACLRIDSDDIVDKNDNIVGAVIDCTDIDSVAHAIRQGIVTIDQIATQLGVDLIDDCLVINRSAIGARDVSYGIETNCEYHRDAAEEYADGFDPSSETQIIDIATYRSGINRDGAIVDCDHQYHTIVIPAEEPPCTDSHGHDWRSPWKIVGGCKQNPGVFGNGGGVIIKEVCHHCGCKKTTNTWAQHNGQQGYRTIEYSESN